MSPDPINPTTVSFTAPIVGVTASGTPIVNTIPPAGSLPALVPDAIAATATVTPAAPRSVNNTMLITATVVCGFIMASAIFLSVGEPVETKLRFFQAAAFPVALVYAVALGAMGYNTGKFFEGVVPVGYQAAAGGAAFGLLRSLVAGAATQSPAASQLPPSLVSPPPAAKPPINSAVVALIAAGLVSLCFGGGCVSTSQTFRSTVKPGVDTVVLDIRDYSKTADYDRNHNGVIDPEEAAGKAAELAATNNLAASVADVSAITVEGVAAPWQEVEPIWRAHVNADPTLTDEDKRQQLPGGIMIGRLATGDAISDLIAKERARQAAIWASLGFK